MLQVLPPGYRVGWATMNAPDTHLLDAPGAVGAAVAGAVSWIHLGLRPFICFDINMAKKLSQWKKHSAIVALIVENAWI